MGSVKLLPDLVDALGEQVVGDLALDRFRQDARSRRDRGIGGGGADVGKRLRFGERDLAFGGLGAARDEVFHLGLGLGGDSLGFRPCVCDDLLGLTLGAGAAGLVVPQHLGRLVLEAAGVVQLGLDAGAAI